MPTMTPAPLEPWALNGASSAQGKAKRWLWRMEVTRRPFAFKQRCTHRSNHSAEHWNAGPGRTSLIQYSSLQNEAENEIQWLASCPKLAGHRGSTRTQSPDLYFITVLARVPLILNSGAIDVRVICSFTYFIHNEVHHLFHIKLLF